MCKKILKKLASSIDEEIYDGLHEIAGTRKKAILLRTRFASTYPEKICIPHMKRWLTNM
jgi:hypothetical protein